jgi:hypothetical protein
VKGSLQFAVCSLSDFAFPKMLDFQSILSLPGPTFSPVHNFDYHQSFVIFCLNYDLIDLVYHCEGFGMMIRSTLSSDDSEPELLSIISEKKCTCRPSGAEKYSRHHIQLDTLFVSLRNYFVPGPISQNTSFINFFVTRHLYAAVIFYCLRNQKTGVF